VQTKLLVYAQYRTLLKFALGSYLSRGFNRDGIINSCLLTGVIVSLIFNLLYAFIL